MGHVADLLASTVEEPTPLQREISGVGKMLGTVVVVIAVVVAVQNAPRRTGDIMSMVADNTRTRALLDWTPQYDDLTIIATHALAWEEKLAAAHAPEKTGALSA